MITLINAETDLETAKKIIKELELSRETVDVIVGDVRIENAVISHYGAYGIVDTPHMKFTVYQHNGFRLRPGQAWFYEYDFYTHELVGKFSRITIEKK